MNLYKRIWAFREAGAVKRAHTFPALGEYNVAMHSWNAVNLLYALWPKGRELSPRLIQAVLWHDVPERWTGDTPAPTKWVSPKIKNELDALEEKIFIMLEIDSTFMSLTPEQQSWLKGVDLLELLLWAREQKAYGNSIALKMQQKVIEYFVNNEEKFPKEIIAIVHPLQYERISEIDEFLTMEIDTKNVR
jgi:5'-deoxynucleotidase YfbR-like HD superfamily hydrolase